MKAARALEPLAGQEDLGFGGPRPKSEAPEARSPFPQREQLTTTPCQGCGEPVVIALDQDGRVVALDPDVRVYLLLQRHGDRLLTAYASNGCARHRCRSTSSSSSEKEVVG